MLIYSGCGLFPQVGSVSTWCLESVRTAARWVSELMAQLSDCICVYDKSGGGGDQALSSGIVA